MGATGVAEIPYSPGLEVHRWSMLGDNIGFGRQATRLNAPLRDVSDTALYVAMYRAMESERPDAIFRDPYARRLAGDRGDEIVRSLPRARSLARSMIVRTAVMEGPAFFAPLGWRQIEFRSTRDESLRLGRSVPLAGLWNFLGRLRSKAVREKYQRMSGIGLWVRDASAS